MRQDIRLYINNIQVDLKEEPNILFTYQLEERSNPTVIKNKYSKAITLEETEGTPNNHLIFGSFYNTDRRIGQGGTPGNQFDPSKRVPFQLFVNGDLQESGYAQLTKVQRKGKQIIYSVNLYGGLGDFWYSLHMKDDGETRTLADLKWKNLDSNGNILPPDEEFDFRINKECVEDAWSRLGAAQNQAGRQLFDTINFATLYEGTPNNFDANKILINTTNSNAFPDTLTSGSSSYTAYNGFGMGELNKSYDGWVMRDLRSYLQKPVLNVRRLVEACCDPENNGGYNVDLDPEFFNMANPYYSKAWLTLPSLIIDGDGSGSQTYGDNTPGFNPITQQKENVSSPRQKGNNQDFITSASTPITVTGETINSDSSGVLDLTDYPFSYLSVSTDVGMVAEASTTLPLDMYFNITHKNFIGAKRYDNFVSTVFAQLVAFDADTGEKIGGSDIYRFRSAQDEDAFLYARLKIWFDILEDNNIDISYILGQDFYPGNITEIKGNFQYDSVLGAHKFVSTDNFFRWRLDIGRLAKRDHIRFRMVTTHVYSSMGARADDTDYYFNYWGTRLGYLGRIGKRDGVYNAMKKVISYGGGVTLTVPSEISSGAHIDKKKLLSTDESAADFLLSYSKMFGLYWWKDIYSNTVYCRMRNNFFTGEVENLDDKIDYSKDIITTPILFDKHFYSMSTQTPETKYSKRYKELYSRIYGSQKINTNFNFNNDTTELYDSNIFTNLIQVRDTGDMYKTYFNKAGARVPTPMISNIDYTLYDDGKIDESFTKTYTANDIDFTRTVDFYPRGGYDFMTHPCAFTDDGDARSSVSNKYTLLFFDLFTEPTDASGNRIQIYLTDDVPEMITLNTNRCWIYTESAYDARGNVFAYPLSSIPNFSRYYQNRLSFDFGTPQEYYVDDLSVDESGSIYNRYWKNYLHDQFNANTRMMTCYVKWDKRIMEDAMRKFYWFDNRLWVLNKVTDYSITKYNTVKCEFISVDDAGNYTQGQATNI